MFVNPQLTARMIILEIEIILCIIVTDVFHHLLNSFHFTCRHFSVLDVVAEEIA